MTMCYVGWWNSASYVDYCSFCYVSATTKNTTCALKILRLKLVMGHIFGCNTRSCAFYYGNGSPDPPLCAPVFFCMVSKIFFNFWTIFDRPSLRPRKSFPYYYLLIVLGWPGSRLSGWLMLKFILPQSWSGALSISIFFCWCNYLYVQQRFGHH